MRVEELEKEAELYGGDRECYVHMEKVEGQDIKVIANGGKTGLSLAAYVLMLHAAEEMGTNPLELLKFYKKMYKKHGMPDHSEV